MTATKILSIADGFRDLARVSDAELAQRIGLTRQALHLWRKQGLKALPARDTLQRLATVTGTAYESVLDAALHDAGYLEDGWTVSAVAGPAAAATTITGRQLRDLYREQFADWTGTQVSIYDADGDHVATGSLAGLVLALRGPDDGGSHDVFYSMGDGDTHLWAANDRVTIGGAHPPTPGHLAGGRDGKQALVSDLRIGDLVYSWRGNGLRVLKVVSLSPAEADWADVRISFVDVDSGETITHPSMSYADRYTLA